MSRGIELVLGGSGLIGRELVHQLRKLGRKTETIDLRQGQDLRTMPLAFDVYERVWFLAWDTGGAKYLLGDNQHEMFAHNSELCVRVFSELHDTEVPFLFVTSQLAGQKNAYGLTKLVGEHWARALDGRVARLWNTYGWEEPNIKSHVITDLVLSALTRGRVQCLTSGEERRRFLYKADAASALIRFFDSTEPEVDIAGPEWLAIRDVATEIAGQLSVATEFGLEPGIELMVEPKNQPYGWTPLVPLKDGIARVIEDARAYLEREGAQK